MGTYLSTKNQDKNPAKTIALKVLKLPPLQAMILGLSCNLVALSIPAIPLDVIETISKGNKPMVLLLMGIYFSIRLPKKSFQKVFQVLSLRYVLGMSVGLTLYYLLPFNDSYRNMLMICLILPAGMTLITYSDEFDFDTGIAAALVNFSMLISFTLMWILVGVFHMSTV
jgi:predicted permease